MIKKITVGDRQIILSATKKKPVYKKERKAVRAKFLKPAPSLSGIRPLQEQGQGMAIEILRQEILSHRQDG